MSRLPTRLQPFWPVLKRVHRLLTLVLGVVGRRLAPLHGARGVPRTATTASAESARREPAEVVVHPGGAAERIERVVPAGRPVGHPVFAAATSALVPPRFTLEVRDARLVGDYAAVITPAGVLDHETSPYFGIAGWREHPVFLHQRLPREQAVPGTVLSLATRGASTNYYHFLYDAIGRYAVFHEAMPGERPDAVVVPTSTSYQRQLLELAGIEGPFLPPPAEVTYRVERLLVPSSPNHALDAPPWVVAWLRDRLPARPGVAGPRRIYLTRGNRPNSRRYVQEPELVPRLERLGFVVVDPGSLSVQEQIDLFAGADVVVADRKSVV